MDWEHDFEIPAAKKPRCEPSSSIDLIAAQDMMEDEDDLYDTPPGTSDLPGNGQEEEAFRATQPSEQIDIPKPSYTLPGLGLFGLVSEISDHTRKPSIAMMEVAHIKGPCDGTGAAWIEEPASDEEKSAPILEGRLIETRVLVNNEASGSPMCMSLETQQQQDVGMPASSGINNLLLKEDHESTHTTSGIGSGIKEAGSRPERESKHFAGRTPSTSDPQAGISYRENAVCKGLKIGETDNSDGPNASKTGTFSSGSAEMAQQELMGSFDASDWGPVDQNGQQPVLGRRRGTPEAHFTINRQEDLSREEQRDPDPPSNIANGDLPRADIVRCTSVNRASVEEITPGLAGVTPSAICSPGPHSTRGEASNDIRQSPGAEQDTDIRTTTANASEFELDSSPYESSSEDSTDSSSDETDNDYKMLDPAGQARLLMQEDGGSEDEVGKKEPRNGPLRTLNEKPDENVEKPDIIVTTDTLIEELGNVEALIDNIVLVKAKTSGEYQVLETGSLLCLDDRTVIGVVAETLGRVQQPLYSVRFTDATAITESGISKQTTVYYVPQHSSYAFTQALKAVKGSDASNIHDEEVGDDELEFSDDEAEAEYKRIQKLQRQSRRDGRGTASRGCQRGPRQRGVEPRSRGDDMRSGHDNAVAINYDDGDNVEELYTPLARPANLHEMMGQGERSLQFQQEGHPRANNRTLGRERYRGPRGNGGRGGRGGQGRGRDRGRRNGDHGEPYSQSTTISGPNLSLPPNPTNGFTLLNSVASGPMASPDLRSIHTSHASQQPTCQPIVAEQLHEQPRRSYSHDQHPYPYQASTSYHPATPQIAYQPAPYSHHQYPQTAQHKPQYPVSSYTTPPLPPGAFVNPAFFGNQYSNFPSYQRSDRQDPGPRLPSHIDHTNEPT